MEEEEKEEEEKEEEEGEGEEENEEEEGPESDNRLLKPVSTPTVPQMHRRRRSTLIFTFTRTVQIFATFGMQTLVFEMALLIFKPNLDKVGLAKKILTLIFHFKVVHNA